MCIRDRGSTFYSVILRPWVLVRLETNLRPSARLISIASSILFSGILAEVFTRQWTVAGEFFTAFWSVTLSSECVNRYSGQSASCGYEKARPLHHILRLTRSLAVRPRQGKSAGFRWEGQSRHEFYWSWISNFINLMLHELFSNTLIFDPTSLFPNPLIFDLA